MSGASTSVFISRISSLPVLDTAGDQIGRVRDVVIQRRVARQAPRVKGLVVELFARHRIFVPMARIKNIDALQVVISGVVNARRFERRDSEMLVIHDLFDLQVKRQGEQAPGEQAQGEPKQSFIFDVSMRPIRSHDWELAEVAVREGARAKRFGRRGPTSIVDWSTIDVFAVDRGQGTAHLLAKMEDMKAADVARELHSMSPRRRAEVAEALDDYKLADAMEELPDDEQIQLIQGFGIDRAADILEEMDPDDAADLIADLDPETAATLLELMESEDAGNVKRLMSYEEETAGGMMTPEPVILGPDATVAEALAHVRNPDLPVSLAAMVFVCRQPLETPTGKLLGSGHIQRLLREPPSTLVAAALDTSMDTLRPEATIDEVAAHLATYNLVAAPVVDEEGRLLGAVTVDDLLDHMLPEGWRDQSAIGKRGPGVPRA